MKIPVTLVSGFLGSGKTSFIKHYLEQNKDRKIALVENEIGQSSIDSTLLQGKENTIIEMSNGCICCTINDNFSQGLQNLILNYPELDEVLIESTGIAHPANIIETLAMTPYLMTRFQLKQSIALIDALNFFDNKSIDPIMAEQVISAQHLIINKSELVTQDKLDSIQLELQSINPFAQLYPATFAKVEIKKENSAIHWQAAKTAPESQRHQIKAHSFHFDGQFSQSAILTFIQKLLFQQQKIYRIKALFQLPKNSLIVQSVHKTIQTEELDKIPNQKNELIIIGEDIDTLPVNIFINSVKA